MPNPKGNPEWKSKYGEPTKVVRLPESLATEVMSLLRQGRSASEVLEQLSSISLAHRSQLPEIPAIYLVYQEQKLLYIGHTGNLRQRWLNHERYHQFESMEDARLAWFECEAASQPVIEESLLGLLPPGHNEMLLGTKDDPELKRAFIDKAKADGTSATELLAGFMRDYLDREKDESPINTAVTEANLARQMDSRLREIETRLAERLNTRLLELVQGELVA